MNVGERRQGWDHAGEVVDVGLDPDANGETIPRALDPAGRASMCRLRKGCEERRVGVGVVGEVTRVSARQESLEKRSQASRRRSAELDTYRLACT